MDNLTHTLFAATLARTPLGRAGRGSTAALLIASNAPDIDIVTTTGGSVSYLQWHRGPTHGLLGVVGLGLLTAAVVWASDRFVVSRRGATPGPTGSFPALAAVSMIAVACHIVMDLPTSYGTRLLSPFDWHWYAFDWLPIIDLYLIAVLVLGLLFGSLARTSARRMTTLALVLMGVNYGLRGFAHHQALERAAAVFGPRLPPPCRPDAPLWRGPLDVWPTERPDVEKLSRPCLIGFAAMPSFASPFRWRVIAQMSNAYELHDLDLLDAPLGADGDGGDRMWRTSLRYPNVWTPAVIEAARTRTAQVFLGFSRFPSARSFVDPTGAATVRWSDMRFAGGVFALTEPRRPDPFNVVVKLSPAGNVLEERLGR